jgi:hypothetical protein
MVRALELPTIVRDCPPREDVKRVLALDAAVHLTWLPGRADSDALLRGFDPSVLPSRAAAGTLVRAVGERRSAVDDSLVGLEAGIR